MTAPNVLAWLAPTADQRRQRLVDAVVDLDAAPADLDSAIRTRLHADTSADGIELNALLRCAALLDVDHLAGHIADVALAHVNVEQHGLTTGHDICCQGLCSCITVARTDRTRCDDCEQQPHEALDQQVDQLLGFLRATVSARGVDEYLAGAA